MVSTSDSGSGGGGSNPSGVYMEFVAERFRRKVVALVYAGSNPVKLPRWSVELCSSSLATRPFKQI